MDPKLKGRATFLTLKKLPTPKRGFSLLETSLQVPLKPLPFPARLRGHIAQRFAICLRTPFFSKKHFFEMFPSTSAGNVFLSCQGILSHGGRLSNMQNCEAILQSQEKYTEGFFLGRLRERYCFLPKNSEPGRAA